MSRKLFAHLVRHSICRTSSQPRRKLPRNTLIATRHDIHPDHHKSYHILGTETSFFSTHVSSSCFIFFWFFLLGSGQTSEHSFHLNNNAHKSIFNHAAFISSHRSSDSSQPAFRVEFNVKPDDPDDEDDDVDGTRDRTVRAPEINCQPWLEPADLVGPHTGFLAPAQVSRG